MNNIIKRTWIWGAEVSAPADTTQLLKIITTPNKLGLVFGYNLVCQEALGAGKLVRVRANIAGTAVSLISMDAVGNFPSFNSDSPLAIIKGNGTDYFEGVKVGASTASTLYRLGLLYAEIDMPDDFYRFLVTQ